jgi:HEAT repeat protein
LHDPKPGVRLQAAHVLASLGLPELRDRLAGALADPDVLVRVAVATALADAGDRRGVGALVEAVDHRLARIDALLALGRLGAPEGEAPARRILAKLFASTFDRVAAAGVLAALGRDEGAGYLLSRVGKRRGADRQMAIELLGERGVRAAADALRAIAGKRDDPARGPALRALAGFGDEAGREACARALLDEQEDPDVRMDAAEGLLLAGRDADRDALARAGEDAGDALVRAVAREALELFGRPGAEVRLHLPLGGA